MPQRIEVCDTNTEAADRKIQTLRFVSIGGGQAIAVINHGVVIVQYERTADGLIDLDANGEPIVSTDILGNPKIGSLILEWNPEAYTQEYTAPGAEEAETHTFGAWVGGGGSGGGVSSFRFTACLGFTSNAG